LEDELEGFSEDQAAHNFQPLEVPFRSAHFGQQELCPHAV
jgi:hypothetical protein